MWPGLSVPGPAGAERLHQAGTPTLNHMLPSRAPHGQPALHTAQRCRPDPNTNTRHDSCRVTCRHLALHCTAGVVGVVTQLPAVKWNENRSAWTTYRDQHDTSRNIKYLASHTLGHTRLMTFPLRSQPSSRNGYRGKSECSDCCCGCALPCLLAEAARPI